MKTQQHLELLGKSASDAVTGFKGVITCISFDLYGCVQGVLTPPVDSKGRTVDGNWFDISRLKIAAKKSVMEVPDFVQGYVAEGKKGAAIKSFPNGI